MREGEQKEKQCSIFYGKVANCRFLEGCLYSTLISMLQFLC